VQWMFPFRKGHFPHSQAPRELLHVRPLSPRMPDASSRPRRQLRVSTACEFRREEISSDCRGSKSSDAETIDPEQATTATGDEFDAARASRIRIGAKRALILICLARIAGRLREAERRFPALPRPHRRSRSSSSSFKTRHKRHLTTTSSRTQPCSR
jgi:hypothetical protein